MSEPHPWQTLDSKYLFRKPWLTMRQDRVRLPGGGVIEEYFVWEYPPWVNVVAVTEEGLLVLVRQYRYALGAAHFELPAGVSEPGETDLLQAAQRELLEETGFGGGSWRPWLTTSANPALQTNLTHTFLAEGVRRVAAPQLEATEELTVHLVTPERAREIALGGEMIQALHLAPLLKFFVPGSH